MSTSQFALSNAPATLAARVQTGRLDPTWVWIMLFIRVVGFALAGLLIIGGFAAAGHPDPWDAAVAWWPYQVIAVNLVCLLLLRGLAHREGIGFGELIGWGRAPLGRDLLLALGLLVLALIAGMVGLFGLALLVYGTPPPETMFRPLPEWALWPAMILLPLTNALAETVTYAGYVLPRLEAIWG